MLIIVDFSYVSGKYNLVKGFLIYYQLSYYIHHIHHKLTKIPSYLYIDLQMSKEMSKTYVQIIFSYLEPILIRMIIDSFTVENLPVFPHLLFFSFHLYVSIVPSLPLVMQRWSLKPSQ